MFVLWAFINLFYNMPCPHQRGRFVVLLVVDVGSGMSIYGTFSLTIFSSRSKKEHGRGGY